MSRCRAWTELRSSVRCAPIASWPTFRSSSTRRATARWSRAPSPRPPAGPEPLRVSGTAEPLIAAASVALPQIASALLLPMRGRDALYGWVLLGNRAGSHPFTTDDERLALAAAYQVRAEHESLRGEHAERLRIEAELRASRDDVSAVFEASPVSIIVMDRERIVRAWNAAAERIFGWRADDVIGRVNPIIPPEAQDDFRAMAEKCLAGATITDVSQTRMRKDGTRIEVNVPMEPLHDADGQVRGFVSIASDVSDLRASRERLRALSNRVLSIQEEERTRLARELHDDLGQLLTAIKIDVARLLQNLAVNAPPPARVVEGLLPLIDSTMDTIGRIVSEL